MPNPKTEKVMFHDEINNNGMTVTGLRNSGKDNNINAASSTGLSTSSISRNMLRMVARR